MGSADTSRLRALRIAAAVLAVCAIVAMTPPAVAAEAPTREQVKTAVDKVRADPNMPGTKTERKLRFKERDDEEEDEPEKKTDSLDWLRDFIRSVAEGARWLIWGLGALALAWLVVRLRRWMQVRAGGARPGKELLPSHVGSLDIRPESLPDDIGNAAAALWQRGQHRPALSLLYRGALSRLVHAHEVPVRAASTEGECMLLSATRLTPDAQAFFVRLVGVWQLGAYGGRLPSTAQVLAVCGEFDRHLSAAAPAVADLKGAVA
ncbi:DUF4129 domain-containing protein [Variovorax sp. YR566]|uniref:DUF4129 domain-containing protein n=1 Tax=Variovorax sp. YR566 TaxID=3450237 RepID=UPI003F7DD720